MQHIFLIFGSDFKISLDADVNLTKQKSAGNNINER